MAEMGDINQLSANSYTVLLYIVGISVRNIRQSSQYSIIWLVCLDAGYAQWLT